MRFIYPSFLLLVLVSFRISGQSNEGFEISKEMLLKSKEINTLYFEMTKTERIGEEYFTESFKTKLSYRPFLVYSTKIEVDKSPEILFRHGENDNKAVVNPDGFPWFNISLDPMGSFMRKNQHHTLFESGYRYAMSILAHLFDKYGEEVSDMTIVHASQLVNDKECYIIEFDNYRYKLEQYKIKKGENILDIAARNLLSEYLIVELNEEVDDFEDVKPGQIITIPNDYCPRMIMAIDKKRLIPLSIKVYDDKGLFEQFEYRNVKVDPSILQEEFTEDYHDYGF